MLGRGQEDGGQHQKRGQGGSRKARHTRPGHQQAAPYMSRRPAGQAHERPTHRSKSKGKTATRSQVLSLRSQAGSGQAAGPSLLVTGRLRQMSWAEPCRRPHAPGSPELTYSSRLSQLLAALARGVQTDVFTLTSLLTGVFTLGETG